MFKRRVSDQFRFLNNFQDGITGNVIAFSLFFFYYLYVSKSEIASSSDAYKLFLLLGENWGIYSLFFTIQFALLGFFLTLFIGLLSLSKDPEKGAKKIVFGLFGSPVIFIGLELLFVFLIIMLLKISLFIDFILKI